MRKINVQKAKGLELLGYKSTIASNDLYLSMTLGSDHFSSLDQLFRLLLLCPLIVRVYKGFKKNTSSLNFATVGF